MAEICPKCGLPLDMCICKEIVKEQQKITIRLETRKYNKPVTIIEGIDGKSFDLEQLARQLKSYCACGGTTKNNSILLQGDQRRKVNQYLVNHMGFSSDNITVI
ncbi:stress response translation initiation inhibitor YciH [Candidatus Bathyarchaeota archaeon ex4484_205]|nr:MAG: stress response translation initiation inhibitor YciH [Candidatus Bathyarchaeota archaeon ex4484_205]RLG67571.1 MAG: stress response translation initiation inhibitor YciH [archaeon]